MPIHLCKTVFIAGLTLVLAACGSSPRDDYYLLSAAALPGATGNSPSLGIGPVEIPEYLSREKMVFQRRPNTLDVADSRKWAEPLEDGIKRVLALNLSSLVNTQDVRFYPWHPKRPPQYGVKVNIMSMDATPSGASMTAEWLVYRANSEPVTRKISRLEQAIDGPASGQNIAATYSALLQQLSELIGAAVAADAREGNRETGAAAEEAPG